jgi:hypothetical protein
MDAPRRPSVADLGEGSRGAGAARAQEATREPEEARSFHGPALRNASLATALLAGLIVLGSRRLADFDSALVGYTFASLFAAFGIVYRYSVWLSKPPTRLYWRRGIEVLLSPRRFARLGRVSLVARALWSKLIAQDFVLRRGVLRWGAHMLIAWGCLLAAAVTFPLVFGWLHFEQGASGARATYRVVFLGLRVAEVPLRGVGAWLLFHALIISGLMVTPGVMLAMWRRMRDGGALAVQRFARDLLPLVLLLAVSVSGLLLWVSYEWLHGYSYGVLAHLHALTVIATLLYLPFGKLFHVFQRPASLGVAFYKAAGAQGAQAECPVTHAKFAPAMQTRDLSGVLQDVGFQYGSPPGVNPPRAAWNAVSPRGRRMLIARAHAAARKQRFH